MTEHMGNGRAKQYAQEIAAQQRDPYSLVEEILRTLQ
jgi:hypothetical protein